jgi:redox-sensitive bicupin YhaK (pirin superfamily)
MNSLLTILERPAPVLNVTPLFVQNGLACSLLTLDPGAEATLPAGRSPGDQVLFVVDGDIAIHAADLTTLVKRDEAFLLPRGESPVISARTGAPARVLRLEIPPRPVATPQIITPGVARG